MTHAPMPAVQPAAIPEAALLDRLRKAGCFVDCFTTVLPIPVTCPQFVAAFYTTPLFKAERLVLRLVLGRRSTDRQAQELADGNGDRFAVWRMAERTADEILLTDERGQTSSWLMVSPEPTPDADHTRLFFGSAIKPRSLGPTGEPKLGPVFQAILGFHEIYSRLLLQAAANRLLARQDRVTAPNLRRP